MSGALAPADRKLLDRVQAGVPLVELPFAALAGDLGTDERNVLARLRRLAEARVLRQIGAIFDTRACGYTSALVAGRVAPGALERAAAAVAAHPGVSHCYERGHAWNLWFTLAVPPTSRLGLQRTVELLGAAAAAESIRTLPALRVFKIAARFDMDETGAPPIAAAPAGGVGSGPRPPAAVGRFRVPRPTPARASSPSKTAAVLENARGDAGRGPLPATGPAGAAAMGSAPLSDEEIEVVRALQKPLALVEEPFATPAREAGMSQAELLACAKTLLDRGVMRRFAGLLNHGRAGFGANVMAAWALPARRTEEAGTRIAGFRAVTHCYERPVFADWPYALFSMIHGRTREECLCIVDAIRIAVGPDGAALLWTLREFKKTRLQLFTPDYEAWETSVTESRR